MFNKSVIQFLFYCLVAFHYSFGQKSLNRTFVNWNKASIESLKRHRCIAKDSTQKDRYDNRLKAIKNYLEIENEHSINHRSIRYEFLNEIFLLPNLKKSNFFVIEASLNSYSLLIRNFLIVMDSANRVSVYKYTYTDGKWQAKRSCMIDNLYFNEDLGIYEAPYGQGFNNDDVIVSFFRNNGMVQSEYFINFTVSKNGSISEILSQCK